MAGAKRRPSAFVFAAATFVLFVILGRSRREASCVEGAANHNFVILGRSKERSDAAQTLGSMPLPLRAATVQNMAPCTSHRLACILSRLRSPADVTEWILGSARRVASLRPRMTNA
ncbi:Uncharacterized protein MLTONO_1365 [Mesorhizobium loti]|nr:Uncharacterized protein MLTONO_1365 [Mesorhizobium loti]